MKCRRIDGTFSSFSAALSLPHPRDLSGSPGQPLLLSFVGAGGKTTALFQIAREQYEEGHRVLVTTTTHMQRELSGFFPGAEAFFASSADQASLLLEEKRFAVLGSPVENGKISWPGDTAFSQVRSLADRILVEADGSRGLPCKFPAKWEPVIPPDTDRILVLTGMSAIGKMPRESCHRYELAETFLKKPETSLPLCPKDLAALLVHGYLEPLRRRFPPDAVIPVWNQADTPLLQEEALRMLRTMGETGGIVSVLK
ncbi:MAG: selenium cofactor biosynthesis protein YqeC [Candidatus Limivivens sp.]|nr:selenium cofactor biosynthesis protein YqeC [Candidatus Limivivens sp.]